MKVITRAIYLAQFIACVGCIRLPHRLVARAVAYETTSPVSTSHPVANPDSIEPQRDTQWEVERYSESADEYYDAGKDKLKSFFSSAADTTRDTTERVQRGVRQAEDKAAEWLEHGKEQARDWLGRVKESTEDMSDEAGFKYRQAKRKAKHAYYEAADQYYRAKEKAKAMADSAADAFDHSGFTALDYANAPISGYAYEEIDRMKMRQWVGQAARALETTPFTGSSIEFPYDPRKWFKQTTSNVEERAEQTYERGKDALDRLRWKARDAAEGAKEAAQSAKQRTKRYICD